VDSIYSKPVSTLHSRLRTQSVNVTAIAFLFLRCKKKSCVGGTNFIF
jgi:hypothetical protein